MNTHVRGIRNNNPLNIIKSPNQIWLGQTHIDNEKKFCQFSTMAYGLRAAIKLLRTYYTKHRCTTIRKIICRWAPETENQVTAYIKTVCSLTHLDADQQLPPMKAETKLVWCSLVLAMATVECGLNVDDREEMKLEVERGCIMLY